MRHDIVAIENAQRRSVFHYRRHVAAEMNDQAVGNIVLANGGFSRSRFLRHQLEIFPELFWIRPGHGASLSSQRVHDEIRAIRAESCLGPAVPAIIQFAAAKQIRQPELLGDRGPKSFADETPNFDWRCLARMPINLDPSLYSDRAKILLERNRAAVSRQLDLSPSWSRRRAARETDFVRAGRRQIAAPIFGDECNPFDPSDHAARFQFDVDV